MDLAVVSCGGAPKDINFIQAHKALDYGVRALREGGTIILLAACPDGFGNKTFFSWFRHPSLKEFETALRSHYEINGQTAYSTRLKAERYRIILLSEFGEQETRGMGMEKAADLDEALRMAHAQLPAEPKVVVIPDGGTVLPIIQNPPQRHRGTENP
jgi:lactate racemase